MLWGMNVQKVVVEQLQTQFKLFYYVTMML